MVRRRCRWMVQLKKRRLSRQVWGNLEDAVCEGEGGSGRLVGRAREQCAARELARGHIREIPRLVC